MALLSRLPLVAFQPNPIRAVNTAIGIYSLPLAAVWRAVISGVSCSASRMPLVLRGGASLRVVLNLRFEHRCPGRCRAARSRGCSRLRPRRADAETTAARFRSAGGICSVGSSDPPASASFLREGSLQAVPMIAPRGASPQNCENFPSKTFLGARNATLHSRHLAVPSPTARRFEGHVSRG